MASSLEGKNNVPMEYLDQLSFQSIEQVMKQPSRLNGWNQYINILRKEHYQGIQSKQGNYGVKHQNTL